MPKTRHIPIRSCVVCRQTSDKRTLLRVVRQPEKDGGAVVADPTGKKSGRGAYICPQGDCIEKAQKQRRFERALSVPMGSIDSELFQSLSALSAAAGAQAKPAQSEPEPASASGA